MFVPARVHPIGLRTKSPKEWGPAAGSYQEPDTPPESVTDSSIHVDVQISGQEKQPQSETETQYLHERIKDICSTLWSVNWSNWALVGIAIWAGKIAIDTVKAIQKQATAQMDADRGWILANIHRAKNDDDTILNAVAGGVIWEIEIAGNTPVRILTEAYRYRAVPSVKREGKTLPDLETIPTYTPEGENRTDPTFLAPHSKSSRYISLDVGPVPDMPEIHDRKSILCTYGRIDYEDVFGRKSFTQFCALYHPRQGRVFVSDATISVGGFHIGGPKGYNHNT
jgi:hypothetical protein